MRTASDEVIFSASETLQMLARLAAKVEPYLWIDPDGASWFDVGELNRIRELVRQALDADAPS